MSSLSRPGHVFGDVSAHEHAQIILGDVFYGYGDQTLAGNAKQREILTTLSFKDMNARRTQISKSKAKHLDWIWSEIEATSAVPAPAGPGFVKWLKSRQSLFWIAGKPASGKSTLMDYVAKNQLCRQYLNASASASWLIVYFFFDYRAHLGMANSLDGLMRALLFQLVATSPAIAGYVERSELADQVAMKSNLLSSNDIQNLVAASIEQTRSHVCVFVDGLDEYGGDLRELQTCMLELAQIKNIKICMASRPEPLFIHAFKDLPHISMQTYNHSTIREYSLDCLTEYAEYLQAPELLATLTDSVTQLSEGVILWTHFACRELVDGMLARETIEELQERLTSYPSDLQEVYQRLIDRTDVRFRSEIMTILFLIEGAAGGQAQHYDLISALSWLRHQNLIPSLPLKMLDKVTLEHRLHSRLGGLIEITGISIAGGLGNDVRLVHKTLTNFLKDTNAYDKNVPAILCPNNGPSTAWRALINAIVAKNIIFRAFTPDSALLHLSDLGFTSASDPVVGATSCIRAYELLGTRLRADPQRIVADYTGIQLALNKAALAICSYPPPRVDAYQNIIMSDVLVFNRLVPLARSFSFDWTIQEWSAIALLPAAERALLFCLEINCSPIVAMRLLDQIQRPRLLTVRKCLMVLHLRYHMKAGSMGLSDVSEVEKWLQHWLEPEEQQIFVPPGRQIQDFVTAKPILWRFENCLPNNSSLSAGCGTSSDSTDSKLLFQDAAVQHGYSECQCAPILNLRRPEMAAYGLHEYPKTSIKPLQSTAPPVGKTSHVQSSKSYRESVTQPTEPPRAHNVVKADTGPPALHPRPQASPVEEHFKAQRESSKQYKSRSCMDRLFRRRGRT